jgi:hypothetical protein
MSVLLANLVARTPTVEDFYSFAAIEVYRAAVGRP